MDAIAQTSNSLGEGFQESAHDKHYEPLWTVLNKMVPPRPNPRAVPTVWRYNEMRPDLMKAGAVVSAEEAERRVLMLVNANMGITSHLSNLWDIETRITDHITD